LNPALDPDILIENIKNQQTFIIFQSSNIVLDKASELENYGGKKFLTILLKIY
jgi:hypothetical protein